MSGDAALQVLMIVGVGLVVGWAAAVSGLGGGLALPLLAAFGLGLPAALLAVKLPVTVSDVASAWVERRRIANTLMKERAPRVPWQLVVAGVSGALAIWGAMALSHAIAAIVAPLLALLAIALRQQSRSPSGQDTSAGYACAWGAYVGGCGVGAGVLLRLHDARSQAQEPARSTSAATVSEVALRAAANTGALVLLLGSGQEVTLAVALLAASQGAGACLASRLQAPNWLFTRWPITIKLNRDRGTLGQM